MLAALILMSGCTSIPHVNSWVRVGEGRYNIRIDRDYYISKPEEFKYVINSFVIKQGGTSYDVVVNRQGMVVDCLVTIPGSQPVENLPEVKHFHRGRTVAAIVIPAATAILLGAIIAPIVLMATLLN